MKAFCGIDWASDHQNIAVVDEAGSLLARARIDDTAEGLDELLRVLAEQGDTLQWLCSRRRAAFRQQFGRRLPLQMFMRTDSSSVATAGSPSAAPRKTRTKALATGVGGSRDRAVADRRSVPPVLVNNDSAGRRAPPGVVHKRCLKS